MVANTINLFELIWTIKKKFGGARASPQRLMKSWTLDISTARAFSIARLLDSDLRSLLQPLPVLGSICLRFKFLKKVSDWPAFASAMCTHAQVHAGMHMWREGTDFNWKSQQELFAVWEESSLPAEEWIQSKQKQWMSTEDSQTRSSATRLREQMSFRELSGKFTGVTGYSELKRPMQASAQEGERLMNQTFRTGLIDIKPGQCDKISPQPKSS